MRAEKKEPARESTTPVTSPGKEVVGVDWGFGRVVGELRLVAGVTAAALAAIPQ